MDKLKPCPWRIHGERTASLTIAGEYFYNEYSMPCMIVYYTCGSSNYKTLKENELTSERDIINENGVYTV